jgi:hypothetical protein
MSDYQHHVSGFFVERSDAYAALDKLLMRGLSAQQMRIYDRPDDGFKPEAPDSSKAVLKNLLVDGAVGAGLGTGVGVLAEVALVAANVTLLVASPLVAPLMLLGWGAAVGGILSAVVGSESSAKKHGKLADLVQDAITAGQVVLVVKTHSEYETVLAQQVIERAVGSFEDVDTA